MTYDVKISEKARQDMKAIYEYIAYQLLEPVIAEKQYTRIEDKVYTLDFMPERHRLYDKEPWRSRNLRILLIDNYIAFYIVDNLNHIVTVMRIMHGSRNIEKELDDTGVYQ